MVSDSDVSILPRIMMTHSAQPETKITDRWHIKAAFLLKYTYLRWTYELCVLYEKLLNCYVVFKSGFFSTGRYFYLRYLDWPLGLDWKQGCTPPRYAVL